MNNLEVWGVNRFRARDNVIRKTLVLVAAANVQQAAQIIGVSTIFLATAGEIATDEWHRKIALDRPAQAVWAEDYPKPRPPSTGRRVKTEDSVLAEKVVRQVKAAATVTLLDRMHKMLRIRELSPRKVDACLLETLSLIQGRIDVMDSVIRDAGKNGEDYPDCR